MHADDLYGKAGLEDGAEPMTRERAMKIFHDFFRFGDEMDPDAPERSKGFKRAAGGVVYAPAKGLLYGGKTVLGGVIMGTAAVVAGASAMVANVALGVKEMGEAGVQAARKRSASKASSESSSGENSNSNADEMSTEKPGPTFMSGLKKATVGAVAAPVAVRLTAVAGCGMWKDADDIFVLMLPRAGYRDGRRRAARERRRGRRIPGRRLCRCRQQRGERRGRGQGGQQAREGATARIAELEPLQHREGQQPLHHECARRRRQDRARSCSHRAGGANSVD